MNKLPQHKASQYSECGVVLHCFDSQGISHASVCYSHQDDYYVLGLLTQGRACGIIDFKDLLLTAGDVFLIQPGQVHRFVSSEKTLLPLLFLATIITGIKIHLAGHGDGQAGGHSWLVAHVVLTVIFTVSTILHIFKRKK